MDKQCEEELLLHIAAGTDPLTAFAALPREDESLEGTPSTQGKHTNVLACIVVAGAVLIVWWLLIR